LSRAFPKPGPRGILNSDRAGTAESGGWALLAVVVTLTLGSTRALVAARLMDVTDLGAMGIALLALATVDALTASGADTALVSHPGDPTDDLDPAFTLRAFHGAAVAAILWVTAPITGQFFDLPDLVDLIRALSLVPILRGVSNPAAILLVKRLEFRRLFWWGLPESFVGIALVISVGLARGDVWALAVAVIGAQAVATIVSYAAAPRIPRFTLRTSAFRRLIRYARWMQGTRMLMFAALNLDTFLVSKLLGTAALGFYQLAFRIGEIPISTIGQAAARVTLPTLTRLRSHQPRLRREYWKITGVVTAATTGFAIAIFLAAGPAIAWLLGARWLPVVPILEVLAIAMIFRGVLIIASELFYSVGCPEYAFLANSIRVGVMSVAIYPLLLLDGPRGVASSVLISTVVATLACIPCVYRALALELSEAEPISRSRLAAQLARQR
jgi:O-antigen/teichoic acid export membrane protein